MIILKPKNFFTWEVWGKCITLLLMGVVYLTYVLIGGVVFWQLEGDQVRNEIAALQVKKTKILQIYPCLGQAGLEDMGDFILAISRNGMSLKNNRTAGGFWKFTSSSVFAATVVTTIGYGNISPSTTPGQIFCVIFAIFGIPLNMVVLNRVGKYMLAMERSVCTFIANKTNHQKVVLVSLHFTSFVVSLLLYLVAPVAIFTEYEDWNYSQAIYYCFITLSTVGFGDLVAAYNADKTYPDWYGSITAVWIFFGMAWLALVINHSIDLLESLNSYLKKKDKCEKSDSEQGEDTPEEEQKETEPEEKKEEN